MSHEHHAQASSARSEARPLDADSGARVVKTPAGKQRVVVRNELPKPVRLLFTEVDEAGFGHAIDAKTRIQYLLNQATSGFDRRMKPNIEFQAYVTAAQYVTRVVEVGKL